jgi:hypothetical protein
MTFPIIPGNVYLLLISNNIFYYGTGITHSTDDNIIQNTVTMTLQLSYYDTNKWTICD